MIEDKDFHRLVENEKLRAGLEQVTDMVIAYYRTVCAGGIPADAALALTLHFQERLLNPQRNVGEAPKGDS